MRNGFVIVDTVEYGGGSGSQAKTWKQYWLKCDEEKCRTIFSTTILDSIEETQCTNSIHYTISNITLPDAATIVVTTRRFGLVNIPNGCYIGPPLPPVPQRIVGPTTQELWRWNGNIYQLEKTEQTTAGYEISREYDQESESAIDFVRDALKRPIQIDDGTIPEVASRDNLTKQTVAGFVDLTDYSSGQLFADNPVCRIVVQRLVPNRFELVGKEDVRCVPRFSHFYWADVDGDGAEELLFLTIPPDTLGIRRLYVYRISNGFTKLATIDGYINDPDGVGIKWEQTSNGFRLSAGLSPLYNDQHIGGLENMSTDRRFQTYRWDKGTNGFIPEDSPQTK